MVFNPRKLQAKAKALFSLSRFSSPVHPGLINRGKPGRTGTNRSGTVDNRGKPGRIGVNRLALPVVLKCLIEPGRTGTSAKNRDKPGRHRGKPYLHRGEPGRHRDKPDKPGRLFYPGSPRCWAGIATVYAGGATV